MGQPPLSPSLFPPPLSAVPTSRHRTAVFIIAPAVVRPSSSSSHLRCRPHAQSSSLLRSHLCHRLTGSSSGCRRLRCCDPPGCCPHAAAVLTRLSSSQSSSCRSYSHDRSHYRRIIVVTPCSLSPRSCCRMRLGLVHLAPRLHRCRFCEHGRLGPQWG